MGIVQFLQLILLTNYSVKAAGRNSVNGYNASADGDGYGRKSHDPMCQ